MNPRVYVKLDSWHEAVEPERGSKTLCGLDIPEGAPVETDLPLEEKSCESCLRLARHREENPDRDEGAGDEDPE